MIKPEDIPQELVDHYLRSSVAGSWPEKTASILNAAIEAGVVSPAVWAVVCENTIGEQFVVDMLPTQFEAEQKLAWRKDRVKHAKYKIEPWKGRPK